MNDYSYKAKRCPLCREWHRIDYREECYEARASRIRAMEEDISWLIKEVKKLKTRIKRLKEKDEDEEDEWER